VAGGLRRLSGQASCFPMGVSRSVFRRTIRCGAHIQLEDADCPSCFALHSRNGRN
jgi:hypothetical protein